MKYWEKCLFGLFGGLMTWCGIFSAYGKEVPSSQRLLNGPPAATIPMTFSAAIEPVFVHSSPSWWIAQHDWLLLGAGILGMLLLSLFFLYREYRKSRRNQAIYNTMPLRIFVVDGTGKIRFHQAENGLSPTRLDMLPQQLGKPFREVIDAVLADGKERWREFDSNGTRRKAIFTRLPRRVFGVETVMWISMDITELAQSRDQIRLNESLLRNTAELANIGYFHFNAEERKNTIHCRNFWPEKDGEPILAKEWLVPEDQQPFLAAWRRLFRGETHALKISYRAGTEGHIRDFIMYAQLYEANGGGRYYAGMIQDITELKNHVRDYQDAAGLLNNILDNFPSWVVIKDIFDDLRCVMTNFHTTNQLDLLPDDVIGKTDAEIFPDPDDFESIRRNDRLAVESDKPLQTNERFHDAQGVVHDVVVNRSVVSRADGTRLLVAVITDVSELKRTQRQAEESNQVLRAVLDNVHAGVTVKDPENDYRYMIWNRWLVDKTGLSSEEVLGKNDFELTLEPEVQQDFRDGDLNAIQSGQVRRIVEKVENDGRITVNDVTRKLLTLPWGRRLLITSVSDLTQERKLAQEREETIAQLSHHVEYERIINRCLQEITLQNDMDESIAFLLREIGETTHADRCYIFEIAADDVHINNTYEWHAPDIAPRRNSLQNIDLGEFPGFHAQMLRKQDIAIGDLSLPTSDDLAAMVEFWHRLQVKSLLICGIWENGRLWGYIGIDFVKKVRQLAPSDIHIVHNAGNLVLLTREREHRINELADSVSLQTQIFDNISVPIVLMDTQFNIIKTNSEMERQANERYGVTCGGKCYQRFCRGKTQPPEYCPARIVMSTGKPCVIEREFNKQHMQINAQPIFDRNGKLIYILEYGFDITTLREQQQLLGNYLKQEQVVSECLKLLVLDGDFDTVLKKILQLLGNQIQVDVCAIFRYDEAGEALVNVEVRELSVEGDTLQVKFLERDFPASFRALKSGEFFVDLREPSSAPEYAELAPYLKSRGMQAIACVSIFYNGRFWGNVGMEFAAPDKFFGDMERRLLTATARIIEILLAREALYAKLLNSENEKNMIWELMTVPMVLFDADRNIIRVNPATERLCGKSSAEIISAPCAMTFCQHDIGEEDCPVALTCRAQKTQHREISLFGRDFDISTLPVLENGRLVRILQIFIDITENNANKRKLLQALNAAEAAARAKSTFLATMSHEIRTPLNAVIGFSELLQRGEVAPTEQQEYLRSINFAGNALLQLINDILDLSKLESDQMQIVCEKADLRQLCEEMMSVFSLRAQEKNLELRLDYPADMPYLYCSILRLRQVLLNLIGNAVKFTSEGHITLSVGFERLSGEIGTLRIKVCDTGIGINLAAQEHVFQPFFQQENRCSHQEGTGLGLIISKRLVEHMGGTLSYQSTPGVGTCFFIELGNVRFDDNPDERSAVAVGTAAHPRRKILLVDDVPLNLRVLQAMLKQFNAEVALAASGAEALALLPNFKPDLILTDMWMPEMNGMELVSRIRTQSELDNVIVFAVTADAEADSSFSMELFDGVLLKPISLEKLEQLFRYIGNSGLRGEKHA